MKAVIAAFVTLVASASSAQRTDTVVKHVGAPRYSGISTLVEEMTIGSVDGAEEYTFGEVSDIAVARDGTIYVLDNTIYGVRVYDAKGKYIRTIGRRGRGPGEVASPSGIGLLPDGRLLLWDTANWRINVYSPSGQSLAHWSVGSTSGSTSQMARGMVVDTAGTVYVKRPLFVRPTDGSRPRVDQAWLKVRPNDGAITDTIREPKWTFQPRSVTSENGGAFMGANLPFEPVPVWLMSTFGREISGIPNRYAFEIRTGPTSVISVRRAVEPLPVSAAERDSAKKAIEEKMRQVNPTWSWGSAEIAKTQPYYDAIATGLDGRIWISRVKELGPGLGRMNVGMGVGRGSTAPRNMAEADIVKRPALFDVFEPDGSFVGQVQIPPRVSTGVRRGDYVWGVAYNDDDVAVVKRYRIVWK